MDITKIDKNFAQQTGDLSVVKNIYSLPCDCIDLYGAKYDYSLKCFQRMDSGVAKNITYNIEVLSSTTAGARARFKTNSKSFILNVKWRYLAKMSQMPHSGASGFTLLEIGEGEYKHVATLRPLYSDEKGFSAKTELSGNLKEYILFFSLYNDYIEEITLGFDDNSTVTNGEKYKYDLPILYYGSSITQGGCASRPDNCYSSYISKWHNVDYLNLGFSGGAKGEDIMIDYLSQIKSKIFVCDYDHNAPTVGHLKDTHYKLYEAYRKNNPLTPIVFMTRPDYDSNPNENEVRFKIVKATYKKAISQGDKNVYLVDGRKMFGKTDRENCTVDGCHPNDLGFYRMAKALDKVIKPLLVD